MPHSLRARLGGLRYKGLITDKDYKRLCDALDIVNAIEDIKQEIIDRSKKNCSCSDCLGIIDKYLRREEE